MQQLGSLAVVQTLHFVRHGQALHNVRAEVRRSEGCSFDEFLRLMKEDDAFDAELTSEGRGQAEAAARATSPLLVDLIVCSPLTRAIDTAQRMFAHHIQRGTRVVCLEDLREWNGMLANAQRRSKTDLARRFADVDMSLIPEDDTSWTPALEPEHAVAARGLRALRWVTNRPEENIAIVAHGGIFSATFRHPLVDDADGVLAPRFGNCEVRTAEVNAIAVRPQGPAASGTGAHAPAAGEVPTAVPLVEGGAPVAFTCRRSAGAKATPGG